MQITTTIQSPVIIYEREAMMIKILLTPLMVIMSTIVEARYVEYYFEGTLIQAINMKEDAVGHYCRFVAQDRTWKFFHSLD